MKLCTPTLSDCSQSLNQTSGRQAEESTACNRRVLISPPFASAVRTFADPTECSLGHGATLAKLLAPIQRTVNTETRSLP